MGNVLRQTRELKNTDKRCSKEKNNESGVMQPIVDWKESNKKRKWERTNNNKRSYKFVSCLLVLKTACRNKDATELKDEKITEVSESFANTDSDEDANYHVNTGQQWPGRVTP